MTVAQLDPRALARLTPQQLADMALQCSQESRRLAKAGQRAEAAEQDAECARLCQVIDRRYK